MDTIFLLLQATLTVILFGTAQPWINGGDETEKDTFAHLALHILDHADNSLESSSINHLSIICYDLPAFPHAQPRAFLIQKEISCFSILTGLVFL
jgi:hypothetical protein